jgi:argininosuccinate synthase
MYNPKLASFTMGTEYNSNDATGFIRLFGLQMKVAGLVNKIKSKKSKK